MISEHKINYQFGPPPPGVGPPEIVCFSNQTDFTATRVPGGAEAGQALAFRRPSVTPRGSLTDLYQHAFPRGDLGRRLAEGSFDGGPVPGCVERDLMVVVWA